MTLHKEADYVDYLYTCNKCRCCAVDKTEEMRAMCPSYSYYGFFAYSGGGKGYISQGILEGKVKPVEETAEVAMNCLMCGACMTMCPPGFDTVSIIRDLRSYIVRKNSFANSAHKKAVEKARKGEFWGKTKLPEGVPVFAGEEELLIFLGTRERAKQEIAVSLKKIFEAANISWGALEQEPCSGAPLTDLGDMKAFEKLAAQNIKLLNSCGAERVVAICPHDANALINDYFLAGDLEIEVISLPAFLAELINEKRINVGQGKAMTITYHDPCKLARHLDETDEPRDIFKAMKGIKLVEMERSGESAWCPGEGIGVDDICPELAAYAARERINEARATGADCVITASSYAVESLKKAAQGKPKVMHLAEFVASRLRK